MTIPAAKASVMTTETPIPSTPPLPGPPTMSATPRTATAMATQVRCVTLSPRAVQGKQGGRDGRDRLHEEDVRDLRMVQSDDEGARSDRRADRNPEAGESHRPNGATGRDEDYGGKEEER